MKCASCGKEITYDSGVEYMELITKEMVYGEYCVYPTETAKIILCSDACLSGILEIEMARKGEEI